jgi:hypothetical protein
MNRKWITDRLPTQADADEEGNVRMRGLPGSSHPPINWTFVRPGMDWHHTIYWKPPTEPDRIAALEQRVAELEAALQRVPEAMVSGFENMLQKAMS